MKYCFRPADQSIQLEQSGSPFERYADNGFIADLSSQPEVAIPAGNVPQYTARILVKKCNALNLFFLRI